MNIYKWINEISSTVDALHIQVDLRTKTIRYKTNLIVDHGKLIPQTVSGVELDGLIAFEDDPYSEIERLYTQFKRSVPNKHERLNKGNFKACSGDQLSFQELETNMPRQEARLRLESFILLSASAGLLPWKIPTQFFWQGQDPDLIVYREWII